MMKMYMRFQSTYQKYSNDPGNFAAFKGNVREAKSWNAKQGINCSDMFDRTDGCVFGVTKFSDISREEFKRTMTGMLPGNTTSRASSRVLGAGATDYPTTMDWRQYGMVSPIKDQNPCGICWAFAAVEVVETHYAHVTNLKYGVVEFSVEEVVDCSGNGCMAGGLPYRAFEWMYKSGGLAQELAYPTTITQTRQTEACREVQRVAQLRDYFQIYGTIPGMRPSEEKMAQEVYQNGPVAVGVDATNWQYYQGGLMATCGTNKDHAVDIVGYDMTGTSYGQPFWIVRNHWGANWGLQGYVHIVFGQDMCGIADDVSTVRLVGEAVAEGAPFVTV